MKRIGIPQMAARKPFGRYGPGKRQAVKEADVQEDEVIKQLKWIWRESQLDNEVHVAGLVDIRKFYKKVLQLIGERGIGCSAEDVERFCISLMEMQDDKNEYRFSELAGIFLSALINTGRDEEYTVRADFFEKDITFLGFRNTKNIRVRGSLGFCLGMDMSKGKIVVDGNADNFVGSGMTGGAIIVTGDIGWRAGKEMAGGTITVKGNAGGCVGRSMKDGKIVVEGDGGNYVGSDYEYDHRDPELMLGKHYPMEGGEIIIGGNAGQSAGAMMKGGKITIGGNAGLFLGQGMEDGEIILHGNADELMAMGMNGGEIRIEGDHKGIEGVNKGKIYHKGILIVDK